jgi:D-alanyl-D-alanine carboxypeptidase
MKNRKFMLSGLSILILLIVGCEKEKGLAPPKGSIFNIETFEKNLIDGVNAGGNSPVGWAYTISKNGQLQRSNAFGRARLPVDGAINFALNKEINVASVTKFYTAIAAMQLITANNLTIDSLVTRWLPSSWSKGPGIASLTFRDLLTHRSGLSSTNTDFNNTLSYAGLQTVISTGVVTAKNRNYLNANFALFRILIPSLWSTQQNSPNINIESDAATQTHYLQYMQQNVFGRANLPNVDCTPESRLNATLYYGPNDEANNINGVLYGSWNAITGGGGFYMTPLEMGAVNAYFEHSEILLPNAVKAIMKEQRIGFALASNLEQKGNYFTHNGSISNGNGQGVLAQIAIFPVNGIDCVVIMNTQGITFTGGVSLQNLIYNAYNDSWE